MKFGVITDCQYADIDSWSNDEFDRRFRLSEHKLKEAIQFFNSQDIEFIVHLGDLIDQGIENLDLPLKIMKQSKHKIYHVLGNHDFYTYDSLETGIASEKIDSALLTRKLDMPAKYYSYVKLDIKFVVLDSNEVGVIEWPTDSAEYAEGLKVLEEEKSKDYIYAKPWNGAVSNKQLDWLKDEIKDAQAQNQKVILFAHHQLFPENRENIMQKEKLLKILDENQNIIAYMNGHNHKGDFGVYAGVPCITFSGMVETEVNAYSVVEIKRNQLDITGYGRQSSLSQKIRNNS